MFSLLLPATMLPLVSARGFMLLAIQWEWTSSTILATVMVFVSLSGSVVYPAVRDNRKSVREERARVIAEHLQTVKHLAAEREKLIDLRRRVRGAFGVEGVALIAQCDIDWSEAYKNL